MREGLYAYVIFFPFPFFLVYIYFLPITSTPPQPFGCAAGRIERTRWRGPCCYERLWRCVLTYRYTRREEITKRLLINVAGRTIRENF